MTKVKITNAMLQRALDFARKVVDTTDYSDSFQSNRKKVLKDHFTSKVGEEAVRELFTSAGLEVKGPDYNVYEGREKSWDSDLYIAGKPVAVKTQNKESADRFGLSWMFQCGKYRKDPILNNPNSLVVFVYYDHEKQECEVYPPKRIKGLRFRDPKLIRLKDSKRAVYAEDL